MTITGAIVLFAVIWFMTLFIALPLGLRTHGDDDVNTSDQPAYAPSNLNIKRKLLRVTAVTVLIWALVCGIIMSGAISVSDFDIRGTLGG